MSRVSNRILGIFYQRRQSKLAFLTIWLLLIAVILIIKFILHESAQKDFNMNDLINTNIIDDDYLYYLEKSKQVEKDKRDVPFDIDTTACFLLLTNTDLNDNNSLDVNEIILMKKYLLRLFKYKLLNSTAVTSLLQSVNQTELIKKCYFLHKDIKSEQHIKHNRYETYSSVETVDQNNEHFPFNYTINESNFCSSKPDLRIINIILSAPDDKASRYKIRKLWGAPRWFNATGFSSIFILGKTNNETVSAQIKKESIIYHDIIQLDFIDSYDNLTLKTLSLLHWASHYCTNAPWVLKSDLDVTVNIFKLKRYLDVYDLRITGVKTKIICKAKQKSLQHPNRKGKWKVSYEEYSSNTYPPHCHGPGYIIPRSLINILYKTADKKKPFRLEDVYFTGIVAQKVKFPNITLHNIASRFPWRPTAWKKSFATSDLMILELDNKLGEGSSEKLWKIILHQEGYI